MAATMRLSSGTDSARWGVFMANGWRAFFKTTGGKVTGAAALILCTGVIGYAAWRAWRGNDILNRANDRIFVCSQTGKAFHVDLARLSGQSIPVLSPYSSKNTGYPAELCYWTTDGQVKKEPTAVLLNEMIGKTGPTFCPDCGRLVVGHNPLPRPGTKPPPTRKEYEARHGGTAR